MTIGPDPMTRMRWRSARRGMNQIVNDMVHRSRRRPAGRLSNLRIDAHELWNVDGASQRWITPNLGRHTGATQDTLGQRADGDPDSAGHVVHVAASSSIEQAHIGLGCVSDMKVVAHWRAIPNQ